MTIYLNAAGHGLPSQAVRDRISECASAECARGPIAVRDAAYDELAEGREDLARLFSGKSADVGTCATTISGWLPVVARTPLRGRRILITQHEWMTLHAALRGLAEMSGATLEVLPPLDFAAPDLSAWQARIDDDVALLSVPMVTSVTGRVYPIAEIGALQRPDDALLLVDAAQALGRVPIDAPNSGADLIVGTCRKWVRGPRGLSAFWMSERAQRLITVDELAPTDRNVALHLGLGVALRELHAAGVQETAAAIGALDRVFRAQLEAAGLRTVGAGSAAPGTVTVGVPETAADDLARALVAAGFEAKWPNQPADEPLADEAPTGQRLLRISPHLYNSAVESEALAAVVQRTVGM